MTSSGYLRGVILSLRLLMTALALASCGQEMQRQPEIPVNHILQKQLEVLPQGWMFEPATSADVWTDTDFTWARWAIAEAFYRRDAPAAQISEDIHVFVNSSHAQFIGCPSPVCVGISEGYVPDKWTYHPENADGFALGCNKTDDTAAQSEWCRALIRYQEYAIYFGAFIGDHFSLEDFEKLLKVTDQEMTDFLHYSTVRPGPREVPTDFK